MDNRETTATAENQKALTPTNSNSQLLSPFSGIQSFEDAQRMAKCLAASSMIPEEFHNNVPNCMIALELASRFEYSPFLIMQNLYVIHGRPGFSSQFVIAAIQSCGRYSALHYRWTTDKDGKKIGCRAEATELSTGETLCGAEITLEMAKKEGWSTKNGSKWQTMPEQMLMYRAASFFGRLYAPDVLLGMRSEDELDDMYGMETQSEKPHVILEPVKKSKITSELNNLVEEETEKKDVVEEKEAEVIDEPVEEDADDSELILKL